MTFYFSGIHVLPFFLQKLYYSVCNLRRFVKHKLWNYQPRVHSDEGSIQTNVYLQKRDIFRDLFTGGGEANYAMAK